MTALISTYPDRSFEVSTWRGQRMTAQSRSFAIDDGGRSYIMTSTGRTFSVYVPSPTIAPEGVMLDDDGFPLKDDDGNFLIEDN